MSKIVVLGAGGIGRSTAQHLVAAGHEVVVASRSGRDPMVDGVRAEAVEATDPAAVSRLAGGAAAIVNALNPSKYTTWDREWPPLAAALLQGAAATGAGLVTVSNLYLYGQLDGPVAEDAPIRPNGHKGRIRATMWTDALAAHQAGRVRASEVRASDYFGPGASRGASYLNTYVIAKAAAGHGVRLPLGLANVPHTWTYVDDIGALAARLATDERGWGRAWHVPSAAPRTIAQVAADTARLAGQPAPQVRRLPALVRALARVAPIVRELDETRHQFERPFIVDSTLASSTFGLQPTPWDTALRQTIESLR